MNNPLMAAMGSGQNNIMQMVQQIKANPVQFFMQRKLNVPQNMMNDPNAIVQHLLTSGQVSQEQVNRAYQMAQQFSGQGTANNQQVKNR